jgi:hypothetical protein
MSIVPLKERQQLRSHRRETERHHEDPHRLSFQRPKEPLDDRKAPVLTHGCVPRLHAVPFVPPPVLALELRPLVRYRVLWRSTHLLNSPIQNFAELLPRRLLGKHTEPHHSTRKVVQHEHEPPAEWPTLG